MIGGVQYEVQWNLEHVVDFGGGDAQFIVRADEADRGSHPKARAHPVIGQISGEFHIALAQSDFFVRLAQRRVPCVRIMRFDAAAREADLTGMVLEGGGALREQHRETGARSTSGTSTAAGTCCFGREARMRLRASGDAPASHSMSSSGAEGCGSSDSRMCVLVNSESIVNRGIQDP